MSSTLMTKVEEGEFWWGGAVHDGAKMPLSAHSAYAIDLRREGRGNQSAPFFVSSHGRTVWSEEPFAISFDHGILRAEGSAPILLEQHGATLREGYLGGMKAHFPFDGRCPSARSTSRPSSTPGWSCAMTTTGRPCSTMPIRCFPTATRPAC